MRIFIKNIYTVVICNEYSFDSYFKGKTEIRRHFHG